MSGPWRSAGTTAAVLRWARRELGADAAAFIPLGPRLAVIVDNLSVRKGSELLQPDVRARLHSGEVVSRCPATDEGDPLAACGFRAWRFQPVVPTEGAPIGAVGVLFADERQLSEREGDDLAELAGLLAHALTTEARLQEELEFSQFFSLSLDLLCIADFDGYFKLLNRSWQDTLGYSLEELYARPFVDFVHPKDRQATAREAKAISLGMNTVQFQNRYRCKDGTYRILQWKAAASVERKRIYAVARDVTQQKRFETELARSKEAAEAANHAKSVFLATMSHELRTPLNSVIGFSNLLLKNKRGHLADEELTYLERILSNGRNLLDLIDSILDLSRIEAGGADLVLEPVDVTRLARESVASLQFQAAGRSVSLVVDTPPGELFVESNELRLRQIFLNLLTNGLKFTERGSVTLRVVPTVGGGGVHAVEITDTGPGIPADRLDSIFEPFLQLDSTASRRHGGTGLGLTICRSIAEALGLRLEVESTVGRGTRFRLLFGEAGSARNRSARPPA
ncbi:MAG: ATP-binding protein [Planctomycetota bacterium]